MSAAAVASTAVSQPGPLTSFFHERRTDLSQLGQALQSGDLAGAQTAYNALASLSQNSAFSGSATNPFKNTQRAQDFATIGQDLQSGDLAGAQAAYAKLYNSFQKHPANNPGTSAGPAITITLTSGNGNAVDTTNTPASSPATSTTPASTTTSPITSTVGTTPSTTTPATTTPSTTTTPSPNPASGPEIILNLGNGTGSNTPEIVLNFGTGSGSTSNTPSSSSPGEVVLNLGNASNEQITINLSENASGGEQVGISVNPAGSSSNSNHGEQVTLNLNNANDQIVLNFLNASTSPASTQAQSSALNVVA